MSDKPLLLTMGDPAGIGIEIALMAWRDSAHLSVPDFILIGDAQKIKACATKIKIDISINLITDLAQPISTNQLNILDVGHNLTDATQTVRAIEIAAEHCLSSAARAMITNPIQKKRLYEAGFKHPGHTEFLAELTGAAGKSVMMLACPGLRVVPATIHIPISEVPSKLSEPLLRHVIEITHTDMQSRFGISAPRIILAGLNPHAGEEGSIGDEEVKIIRPLVEQLRATGMLISGPFPADSLFHAKAREQFDVAICMYHDQALIPIKTIDFDKGVNITLGLPIIRTSPDHGTADDIAGKGIANPTSLIEAIKMADEMSRHRKDKTT